MNIEKVQLRRKSPNSSILDPISLECDNCLEDLTNNEKNDSMTIDERKFSKYEMISPETKTYFVYDDSSNPSFPNPQNIPPPMHILNLDRLMGNQHNEQKNSLSPIRHNEAPSYLNPILNSFERMLPPQVEHCYPQMAGTDFYQNPKCYRAMNSTADLSTRDSGVSSHSSNSGQDVIIANLNMSQRRFLKKHQDAKIVSPIEIDLSKYQKSMRTRNSRSTESIYDKCEHPNRLANPSSEGRLVMNHKERTLSPIWKRNPNLFNGNCGNDAKTQKTTTCRACDELKRFFVFRPTRQLHLDRLSNALAMVEGEALRCELCWRKINQISVNLFNRNPKIGLSFYLRNLMSSGSNAKSGHDAINKKVKINRSISNFIRDNLYQLNTSNVGRFLGQLPFVMKIVFWSNETLIHVKISPQKIVRFLMNSLQMRDLEIDEALRLYISKYALPMESQEIDRVIQIFAEVYHESRWSGRVEAVVGDESATPPLDVFHVYGIAYAIIILQTSLHNVNAQKRRDSILKSPINDFIKSLTLLLSEMKDKDSETRLRQRLKLYSNKKLKLLYNRIQANSFIYEDRQMKIMQKLRDAFTKSEKLRNNNGQVDLLAEKKFNWIISPYRRLVCYCAMYLLENGNALRQSPKLRHIFLFNDLIVIAAELLPSQVKGEKLSFQSNQKIFRPPIELLFDKEYLEKFSTQETSQIIGCIGFSRDLTMQKLSTTTERLFIEVTSFSILGCTIRAEKMSDLPYTLSIWQQDSVGDDSEESYWHCLVQLASVTQTDHIRFLKDLNSILFEANLSQTTMDLAK